MIWFACKQCGKVHGRPDHSASSLVFCECGQGNTVPWESTVAAPDPTVLQEVESPGVPLPKALDVGPGIPAMPVLRPVPVSEEKVPARPPNRSRTEPRESRSESRDARGGPGSCFNHAREASVGACEACKEMFCGGCLLTVDGKRLCGPCKNHELRHLGEAPQLSGPGLASVLTAGLGVPLLLWLAQSGASATTLILALLSLVPMALAVALGRQSLQRLAVDTKQIGQSLALTGLIGGLVGAGIALVVAVSYFAQWG